MFTHEIQKPKSRLPLAFGVIAVVLIIGFLFVPTAHPIKGSYTLAALSTSEVKATRAGTVAKLEVAEGSSVDKGAPLFTFDVAPDEAKAKTLETQLAAAQARLKTIDAPAKKKAFAALAKAEAAKKAADAAVAAAKKPTPALDKKAAAAQVALDAAKKAAGPTKAELTASVEQLGKDLEAVKALIATPAFVSPVAGLVTGLKVKAGDAVTVDQVITSVADVSKLVATLTTEEPVTSGLKASIAGRDVSVTVEGGKTTAQLDNAKKDLKVGATGPVEVQGEPRGIVHF